MKRITLVAALVLAAASAAQAQNDRWNWKGAVPAGGTVEIRGVLGDIHAVHAAGSEVVVNARKHARRADLESVDIKVSRLGNRVIICVLYPTPRRSSHENSCPEGRDDDDDDHHDMSIDNNDVNVDFTVEVPANVNLYARTVVGDVDATGIKGDVDARSVTGDVEITADGAVSAESVSGSIRVRTGAKRPDHDLDFKTVSGNITLEVPSDFSADVRLRSQFGAVDSDFDVQAQKTRFGESARGKVGNGGSSVYASTLSGRITLRKM